MKHRPRRKRGNSKPSRKGKSVTFTLDLDRALNRREKNVIAKRNPIGETGYSLLTGRQGYTVYPEGR